MKHTSHSIEETRDFAEKWLTSIVEEDNKDRAVVVGLYGDLGSGKTAFTQAVAGALGIKETVTSPTFVIEKIYTIKDKVSHKKPTTFTHLIHIDAYRLEESDELVRLGWNEIIANPANLILIEWPEKVADIMPTEHIRLKFTFIDETTRGIDTGIVDTRIADTGN